jgi:hypothetical protein
MDAVNPHKITRTAPIAGSGELVVIDETPIDEYRQTLRIQAAAVAAQQIALEDEEVRLQQRRSDLQEQEEQLAAHLAEKQRQAELWSEQAKAERETLRKEKFEQEKRLARIEQELSYAKQETADEHQKVIAERQRIDRVFQRLRQRWQKHWSAEKEKHQKHAKKLEGESQRLEDAQAVHKQRVAQFNAERERALRELQENRTVLARERDGWRRRRSLEFTALKAKVREVDGTQIKIKQAHQFLLMEKQAWDQQLDSLQKELHGLNTRILHQRDSLRARTDEIAQLDAMLRERRQQTASVPPTDIPVVAMDEIQPECEVVGVANEDVAVVEEPFESDAWQRRFDGLDRLASDLADQRLHLIEQYGRLAEIQESWQRQRDHASAELESLARRLLDQEHDLVVRVQQTEAVEQLLRRRHEEIETIRQEIQIWRAQLRAREQMFEDDHQKQLLDLRQKEALLQEQSSALTKLREGWNRRRQKEVEQLRAQRAALEGQQREIHEKRLTIFENGQQVAKEKRLLAEQALALEQYRQEVLLRAEDRNAERRVERLRRRWLTLNAELLRDAKSERNAIRKEFTRLEAERAMLTQLNDQAALSETAAAEKQTRLEVWETLLKGRQAQLEQQVAMLRGQHQQPHEQHLHFHDNVETMAKEAYDQADSSTIDKAA